MSTVLERSGSALESSEGPTPPQPRPFSGIGWGLLAALALLGGFLLFCHGCHGDEDNELWTPGSGHIQVCGVYFSSTDQ